MDEWRELEKTLNEARQQFLKREISESLHETVVKMQASGNVGTQGFFSFERELGDYIKFQRDLKGFWNILRRIEEDCDDVSSWLKLQPWEMEDNSSDDSDADSGRGESVSGDEEPNTKKPTLENDMAAA